MPSQRTHLFLVILALFLAACQEPVAKSVDIRENDTCARCKMAIADVRYAAEVIDRAGVPHKFDEVGCMVSYIKSKNPKRDYRAAFVMDYDSKTWAKAEEATFVKSERIQTPMAGGIVAFEKKPRAQGVSSQFQGQVLAFDDLFK